MIKNGFLFPYQATIIGLMLLLSSSTAWAQADIQYFFTYVGADQFDTVYDTHIREENGEEYIYAVGSSMRHHSNGQPTLDAFVAKYHLHNQQLIFTEFFSGAEHESARQLVLDESGFIYVVGETNSTDFPITNDAQIHQGQWDAFILKLDSDTGDRVYATYFGGSANDFGHAIAVDQQQRIYISGETYSTDLPTSDNAFIKNCLEQNICSTNGENPSNAFIMQLDTRNAAARPAYTSYFGGSGTDKSHSIAIDVFDHVHIAGDTNSIDLPSKSAYQTQLAGGFDGFIARFNVIASKNDQSLQTAGYFGGLHDDTINTIGLDELGNLWIAGETASENLPTTRHAFDRSCGDDFTPCQLNGSQQHNDAYIAKFSHAAGGVLLYSSYWGGRSNDAILHLSIASDARLFVVGMTESPNLAITDNAYDQACGENQLCDNNNDGFIAFFKIENQVPARLLYSSYFGGQDADQIHSLSHNQHHIVVGGSTFSALLGSSGAPDSQCGEFGSCINNQGDRLSDGFIAALDFPLPGAIIKGGDSVKVSKKTRARPAAFSLYLFIVFLGGYWGFVRLNRRLNA